MFNAEIESVSGATTGKQDLIMTQKLSRLRICQTWFDHHRDSKKIVAQPNNVITSLLNLFRIGLIELIE